MSTNNYLTVFARYFRLNNNGFATHKFKIYSLTLSKMKIYIITKNLYILTEKSETNVWKYQRLIARVINVGLQESTARISLGNEGELK